MTSQISDRGLRQIRALLYRRKSLAEWAGSGKSLIEREVGAYVEKATVGSYGVVKATTVADAGSTTAQLEYDYPLDSSPALEVYLSKSGDTALTFRAEFVPCRYPQRGEAGDNFFTRIYMRLKNRQSGAETGWVRMSTAAHDDDTYLRLDPYGYGEVFDSGTLAR